MYIKSSSDVDEVDAPRKRIEERRREEVSLEEVESR